MYLFSVLESRSLQFNFFTFHFYFYFYFWVLHYFYLFPSFFRFFVLTKYTVRITIYYLLTSFLLVLNIFQLFYIISTFSASCNEELLYILFIYLFIYSLIYLFTSLFIYLLFFLFFFFFMNITIFQKNLKKKNLN